MPELQRLGEKKAILAHVGRVMVAFWSHQRRISCVGWGCRMASQARGREFESRPPLAKPRRSSPNLAANPRKTARAHVRLCYSSPNLARRLHGIVVAKWSQGGAA